MQTVEMTEQDVTFIDSFKALAAAVYKAAQGKGWYEEPREDGTAIALIHSELSEGLEALRKDLKSDHIPEFSGIEEELADVVIRVMDFAAHRKLRVAEAIIAKIAFNATRPHKHGGKKF